MEEFLIKLKKEHEEFLNEVREGDTEMIISKAYEIVVKDEIVYVLENLEDEEQKAIYENIEDNVLNYFYKNCIDELICDGKMNKIIRANIDRELEYLM